MTIGKNIKARRLELKMSQDELAEKLFVTRQTISNYEIGKSNPTIEMLQELSTILDCSLDELIYGKKNENQVIDKKKLYKYISILLLCLFVYILIILVEPKIKELQGLYYFNSALLFSNDLFLTPLIFGIYGYIFGNIAKLYRVKIPKVLSNKKSLRYLLRGIACILIVDGMATFTALAIDNINKSNYYYFIWPYRYGILMNFRRFIIMIGLKSSVYSLVNLLAICLGVLISFTKE